MNTRFMKSFLFSAVATLGLIGNAHSTPVTYDFTASEFYSYSGNPYTGSPISGSITFDNQLITPAPDGLQPIAIDLVTGSHAYLANEVGFYNNFGTFLVGGSVNGVTGALIQTDDFLLSFNLNDPVLNSFMFTSADSSIWYLANKVSVAPATAKVSEPASIALLGAGCAGIFLSRRKKVRQQPSSV